MHHLLKLVAILCTLMYSRLSLAGGPLVIEGPDLHTPVTYQFPGSVTLHIESGLLGSRSNAEANAIVAQAFELWNIVDTATIVLSIDTARLSTVDIDSNNFAQYIPTPDESILNANDGLNPVVYDHDGGIIEAYFPGNSDLIAGFAASVYFSFGSYYKEGYIVINGNIQPALSDEKLTTLIAHEIAHFFGLDHTQADISNEDPDCKTEIFSINYPLMYPFLCRRNGLHSDDISALSALYPTDNVYDTYGILQGHFVDESGKPVLGANIWAEEINHDNPRRTVSMVSDYLVQGNGYFKLLLPEGNYTLHANSINSQFYGSSSIGPYSLTATDISFTEPHPLGQVDYLGVDGSNAEVITISPGQTINIDFSITGNNVTLPDNSGGGGGALSGLNLLALLSVLAYRRYCFAPICSQET